MHAYWLHVPHPRRLNDLTVQANTISSAAPLPAGMCVIRKPTRSALVVTKTYLKKVALTVKSYAFSARSDINCHHYGSAHGDGSKKTTPKVVDLTSEKIHRLALNECKISIQT